MQNAKRHKAAKVMGALLASAIGWGIGAGTTMAFHSATVPREFWDLDNDGSPEPADSILPYSRGGGAWTQQKIDRATEAVASWSTGTDYNPWLSANATSKSIWVDGTQPAGHSHCPANADTWAELGQPYAVNCLQLEWHQTGSGSDDGYYRILDSDIFLDISDWTYNWGTSGSNLSARGILTHETGHGASLWDLYPPNCSSGSSTYTMCGEIDSATTWYLYTLTSDDVNAANLMYLP